MSNEQELLAKKVKHSLENWREIILRLYDALLWKAPPIFTGSIFGLITFAFILISYLDLTLLSSISSLCLCLVLLDYGINVIPRDFYLNSWTGSKEKQLDKICFDLANVYITVKFYVQYFFGLKERSQKQFYASTILGLLILSWLGNNVNNVLLTYLFVTSLLIFPGLYHNGYTQKYFSLTRQWIAHILRSVTSRKEKKL